jgi:hypothetical protein
MDARMCLGQDIDNAYVIKYKVLVNYRKHITYL